MSQFYGTITNGKGGKVTKQGTKTTGLSAHISGWEVGINVEARFDTSNGKDTFTVWVTGGSEGPQEKRHVGTFTVENR